MSKVKYRVLEYNPTSAQQGSHSFFAEAGGAGAVGLRMYDV
jgi:hypothetical protein